ncbi:MAG: MarR family transcriptional regulator [Treponema sp.]|jgi:DNA-binding MarR family transcriptional regulator|nr:MarR family transcriptional regulator [Treponema sp.]MBQ1591236.1 MarR family transcriptional regulator [Treponema sp.]MBQ1671847.1 MarR family transcriptional regulator [Treponema sp.]MBQ1714539.1 MarR family transcriptional regulator [Treponema sp.]MBQ1726332.1 MarR family transcriptional regulator [Treponema sp.]
MKKGRTEGGTLISQIHQVCQRIWHAVLSRNGLEDLAGARGRVIFALWNEDNIPIKNLVEKTSLDKATLTGIIDRLERDGYVKRIPSPGDKRSTLISRTGKDEIFKSKIPEVSDQQNKLFYKGFSVKEIKDFENYLKRILQNCKEAEAELEDMQSTAS